MLENIKVLCHNCVRIEKNLIIYTDPFGLKENYNDADIIFITHSHYDHFSPEDIEKVRKDDTIIVVTEDLKDKVAQIGFEKDKIIMVKPNKEYITKNITFTTIPAYNINKQFHPKENNWVGYVMELDNEKYYIAGDTDATNEIKNVKCNIAFVPVGGTYTMTAEEAAEIINFIKPEVAIPVHYGSIVGSKEDAEKFKDLLLDVNCKILL